MRVVGQIVITQAADGSVRVQAELPGGRFQALGMLESAKADLLSKIEEQKRKGEGIQVAPAGFLAPG